MATTVNNILNLAKSWIGKKESNGSHKEIIDIYNAHKPLARGYKVKYTDNWCATFISSLAIKCGATDIIPLECSCGRMIALAKNMGIWQENGSIIPQPGYIIMYDWDKKDGWPEHVGIVESVSGNQFTVIEGNKNDAVGRRTVNVGSKSIRGFITPKYNGASTVQPSQPAQSNNASVNESANKSLYDSWIANLQTELNKQGFRDYEGKKLKVDGINGDRTLSACPTVKKGAKGNITKLIQQRLVSVGFSLNADGDFGKNTEAKVIKFQKNRGLKQDGIVGKNTWTWLLKGTKM